MAYEKFAKLVLVLLGKTNAGNVEWVTTASQNIFQASFSAYTVSIKRSYDEDDYSEYFSLEISDALGDVIDTIYEFELEDGDERNPLKTIFEAARRKALGVEKAIDKILSDLEGL